MKNGTATFSLAMLLPAAALALLVYPARAENPAKGGAPARVEAAKITYACPMDSDVVSEKPGKCPKCGMFLEAVPAETTIYVCPMDAGVSSDKPGKCAKCGMDLEKRTEKIAYVYRCPMDPEVVSDHPGKCPKCGMFLSAHVAKPSPAGKSVPPSR